MTIWRVEGRDMKTGEPVDVSLEADTEAAARERASAAGIWIQRVFDDAMTPVLLRGPVARSRFAKLRARRPRAQPRFVVQVVQHSSWREQASLIVTIGAGITLGFWLTIITLAVFWGWVMALAASSGGPSQPAPTPSFSTPAPGHQRGP